MRDESQEQMTVRVGVQPVVILAGRILLGQRANVFAAGSWGLPGGHLELGETLLKAAARELYEETGLVAKKLRLFCVTDPNPESNHHMQIGVEVTAFEGEPRIMEPHKCSRLEFFDIEALPEPIFVSSVDIIRNYLECTFYRGAYRSA